MKFDKNYFESQKFTSEELAKYLKSAKRDISLAGESKEIEIKFHFSYMALLKIGLYKIAQSGYRVKSKPGHHVKIIEALSEVLNNSDILVIGEKMRKSRNLDMYSAEINITQKDTDDCFLFILSLFNKL